jgi:AcrR family transcriptional regulator
MTELRLVTEEPVGVPASDPAEGPFSSGTPLPNRLPPGRHGIPANLVVEHQRLRLIAAMAAALTEHGYAGVTTTHVSERAGVSTSTFYRHFGNLWDCVLAAYVSGADRLCEEIDAACAARDLRSAPLQVGIDAALAFLAAEPPLAQLLCAQAPREAIAVTAARRLLVSRLAAMLRRDRADEHAPPQPPGLDERLIDATLTFVCTRICAGDTIRLVDLGSELAAILDRPRRAA